MPGKAKNDTSDEVKIKPARDTGRRFRVTPIRPVRRLMFWRKQAEKTVRAARVPNSFVIMRRAVKMLADHWEVFGGILLIYASINIVLAFGHIGGSDLQAFKETITDVFTGQFSKVAAGLTLFVFLVQSGTGVASGVASAYQTVLLIISSLAIIWGLRQFYAGNQVRVRDTFYRSCYPLVQVMLIVALIIAQLFPLALGSFLVGTLVVGGILNVAWQQAVIVMIALSLWVWTIYLLCHSLFAAYIVTLPDMTPQRAIQSAKEIVRYRRGMVLRKLLFLPLAVVIVWAIIMVPMTIILTPLAPFVFFVMSMATVPVVHAYMYTLYRELIQ